MIKYIYLEDNSYYKMGYKYGKELKEELHFSRNELIKNFTSLGISKERIYAEANLFSKRYSKTYLDFLYGMKESSQMSLNDINLLNGMETILGLVQCTFAYIPSSQTEKKNSLIARNYDYNPQIYAQISNNLVVTTIAFNDKIPLTIIGLPGQIYCATGFNQAGLFIQINNGMFSGGSKVNYRTKTILTKLMEILQKSSNFAQADRFISSLKSDYSLIVTLSDKNQSLAYEFSSSQNLGMKKHNDELLVCTNFFLSKDWGNILPKIEENSYSYALRRRKNMISLLQEQTSIDINLLTKIMEIDINQGGALTDNTIYQVIFEPTNSTLLIRRPYFTDKNWQSIPIRS